MVESRIKPYQEQAAGEQHRARQVQIYRRNQALGLVLLAAAVLAWWLLHTQRAWIFPPGWWRP